MDRDYSTFPDDANGDSLWRMIEEGDALTEQRNIEFTVIFETEDDAMKFGQYLLFNRQQVLLRDDEESDEYPYCIVSTVTLVPSYKAIVDHEKLLAEYASPLNGHNDGWGCCVCK